MCIRYYEDESSAFRNSSPGSQKNIELIVKIMNKKPQTKQNKTMTLLCLQRDLQDIC